MTNITLEERLNSVLDRKWNSLQLISSKAIFKGCPINMNTNFQQKTWCMFVLLLQIDFWDKMRFTKASKSFLLQNWVCGPLDFSWNSCTAFWMKIHTCTCTSKFVEVSTRWYKCKDKNKVKTLRLYWFTQPGLRPILLYNL